MDLRIPAAYLQEKGSSPSGGICDMMEPAAPSFKRHSRPQLTYTRVYNGHPTSTADIHTLLFIERSNGAWNNAPSRDFSFLFCFLLQDFLALPFDGSLFLLSKEK